MGERPFLFEVTPIEAIDIDTEYDLLMAELYLRMQDAKTGEADPLAGRDEQDTVRAAR
jgi:hypothetical protein